MIMETSTDHTRNKFQTAQHQTEFIYGQKNSKLQN